MSALAVASILFACTFGGALLGMLLQKALPAHHLSPDSKDAVKLGAGLVATMAALVLGLLVASAKNSFDTQSGRLREIAARIIVFDRVLAHYGPEAQVPRDTVRRLTAAWVHRVWPEDGAAPISVDAAKASPAVIETVESSLSDLAPSTDRQRELKARALRICEETEQLRWLLFGQLDSQPVPTPFLVVLVVWLAVIFFSFGLLAPSNATVTTVLFVSALSVAAAVFLILELGRPFEGIMKLSSEPLLDALSRMGR